MMRKVKCIYMYIKNRGVQLSRYIQLSRYLETYRDKDDMFIYLDNSKLS